MPDALARRAIAPRASYDRIAHLYDVDMARNMAFDDVALYAQLARRANGRVLELGCGNGRVLLELLDRGVDAIGIDCSPRMLEELRRKAAARGIAARACLMDARALAFSDSFALVLCPYSLITYMAGTDDATRMLVAARGALAPGGHIVVDAFVPRAVAPADGFRLDYTRALPDATLTRSKRIAKIGLLVNRVERRYEVTAVDGRMLERIDTSEEVRQFSPADLASLVEASGFDVEQEWWDYRSDGRPADAQFFTLAARRRP